MASYRYKARDHSGKLVEGVMEAPSEGELADKLRRMGYIVTGVTRYSAGFSFKDVLSRFQGVRAEDIIFFNIQLTNMLEAGLPLVSSLRAISSQTDNRRFRKVIEDITLKIETGTSFSSALESYPNYFSRLIISSVRAGEASGKLPLVLQRLAELGERELDLRERVNSALLYPIVLSIAATIVIIFIVTFIIPKFAEIFLRYGVGLPLMTKIFNAAGLMIRDYWYLFAWGFGILIFSIRIYINTKGGRFTFDEIKLSVPVTGQLIRKAAVSRFARTLATLAGSGVPILESLEIVEGAIGNEVLARTVVTLREAVRGGSRLSEPLRVSKEVPQDVVQMVAAGEETGNLDGMLNKAADLYDSAVSYSIKRLTSLLEPIFLAIMGSVVASIMASILIPMFDLVKVLRK